MTDAARTLISDEEREQLEAGAALLRLEKWLAMRLNATILQRYGTTGEWMVSLDDDRSTWTKNKSLVVAINAALDEAEGKKRLTQRRCGKKAH